MSLHVATRRTLINPAVADDGVAVGWWTVEGQTCVCAFDALSASSESDSRIDLTGNGNNLTGSYTWSSGVGWTDGSAQTPAVTTDTDVWSYVVDTIYSGIGDKYGVVRLNSVYDINLRYRWTARQVYHNHNPTVQYTYTQLPVGSLPRYWVGSYNNSWGEDDLGNEYTKTDYAVAPIRSGRNLQFDANQMTGGYRRVAVYKGASAMTEEQARALIATIKAL